MRRSAGELRGVNIATNAFLVPLAGCLEEFKNPCDLTSLSLNVSSDADWAAFGLNMPDPRRPPVEPESSGMLGSGWLWLPPPCRSTDRFIA